MGGGVLSQPDDIWRGNLLKKLIRKGVGWCLARAYACAGARRRAVQRYRQPGTVLSVFAHNPRPKVLDGVLADLKRRGFLFISTDDLLALRDGLKPWRPLLAWLTFDDGWRPFVQDLLPVLEKHDVPATIFVPPHETMRGQVWTNSVMGRTANWKAWYDLSVAERYAQVDAYCDKTRRLLLDERDLKTLACHPLITLENHTYTHLSCSHRPVDDVVDEILQTQEVLVAWTGRTPRLVCYPFGHYTDEVDAAVKSQGLIPVHSDPGVMTLDTLGRFRNMMNDEMSVQESIGRVLGAWRKIAIRHA